MVRRGHCLDERGLRWSLLCAFLCILIADAGAQTLAHKGWAGSGIKVDPWWMHALFYEIDPLTFQDSNGDGFGDLNGITSRLDYLQSLYVDAIVLSPFQLEGGAKGTAALDPLYGTEEDFDRLQREASLRRIRLVIGLDVNTQGSTADTVAAARFWLNRGVAGLLVTAAPESGQRATNVQRLEKVRMLRKLCAGYAGDRVLISAPRDSRTVPPSDTPGPRDLRSRAPTAEVRPSGRAQGKSAVELTVDDALAQANTWSPSVLQYPLSDRTQPSPDVMLVSDWAGQARSLDRFSASSSASDAIAKMLAAVLLLGREIPMLYFGQELGMSGDGALPLPMQWGGEPGFTTGTPWVEVGPNAGTANVAAEDEDPGSLLNWYRKLGQLRHDEGALRGALRRVGTGSPDTIAWVRQPGTRGAPTRDAAVLVVCNLSDHPAGIALTDGLRSLGLAARAVHPLAQSTPDVDPGSSASVLQLPAYGVWVGELRQPGLEAAPAPLLSRRHRGR